MLFRRPDLQLVFVTPNFFLSIRKREHVLSWIITELAEIQIIITVDGDEDRQKPNVCKVASALWKNMRTGANELKRNSAGTCMTRQRGNGTLPPFYFQVRNNERIKAKCLRWCCSSWCCFFTDKQRNGSRRLLGWRATQRKSSLVRLSNEENVAVACWETNTFLYLL